MPKALPVDTPTLTLAVTRLRRTLWVWAALMGGMGLLTLYANPGHPFESLPWLTAAALMAFGIQPAYLALSAFEWGISLTSFIPGVRYAFGADPLVSPPDVGAVGVAGLALVRVLFLVTAWNQFLLYRLLYGTQVATGLDPNLPVIPEMLPNRTDNLALTGRLLAVLALPASLLSWFLIPAPLDPLALGLARAMSTLAVGLGLGAAFSPTRRRDAALLAIGLGAAGFLLTLGL
ncbi:MAG: hypothetical protein ACRDG5_05430, partial [Anaerolineales bacterium]